MADQPDARRTIERALQSAGLDVEWASASDFPAGAHLAGQIDLVVGESNSTQWKDRLPRFGSRGQQGREPVFVVFSSQDEPEKIQELLDAGVTCCLTQSLPPDILERELEQLTLAYFAERRGAGGLRRGQLLQPQPGVRERWRTLLRGNGCKQT